jgi:hypothetical protein
METVGSGDPIDGERSGRRIRDTFRHWRRDQAALDRVTALGIAQQVLNKRGALVTLVVTAGLLTSDWAPRSQRFWASHVMLAAIVSGLLLAAFALFIIEGWSDKVEQVHTRRTSAVAYRGLAHGLRVLRDGLRLLLTAEAPTPEGVPEPDGRCKQLERVFAEIAELPDARSHGCMNVEGRLRALAASPSWVETVFPWIVGLKVEGQRQTAQWAPVMLSSSALAASLNRVAAIVDAFDCLQRPFMGEHRDGEGRIAPEGLTPMIALWDEMVTAAVRVEEDLERATGRHKWCSVREELSERGRQSLMLRDADEDALKGLSTSGDAELVKLMLELAEKYPSAYEKRERLRKEQAARDSPAGIHVNAPA